MQRNVWVVTDGEPLFANLYVVLVSPPGVGKSKVFKKMRALVTGLGDTHHIARSSLTPASLIDDLHDAVRRHVRIHEVPALIQFNSLALMMSELGVLLPVYDPTMMNKLQDLYDCGPFSERRRTRDLLIEIPSPQLNILAACTPAYLQGTMPEQAWAEGFTSRTIFVYSGEQVMASLFQDAVTNEADWKVMQDRLKEIGDAYGKMKFTDEARRYLDGWHLTGRKPEPDHPKLLNYNTRRTVHLIKLSMIASMSESNQLIVELHHIERALMWLLEAEHFIPDIFKSMANTSHSQILQDTWHYVFDTWRREKQKPVNEARVLNFISQRVPAHNVRRVLEILETAGYLRRQLGAGGNEYIPSGKAGGSK